MALTKYKFDPAHSSVGFTVRHLMVSKVHGRFTTWSGTFEFDEENPASSKVEVQIDAKSIDTKDAKRDEHLRSMDFLGSKSNPQITFKSTGVEGKGEALKVKGELTIRGISKPVTLDVEYAGRAKDPWGGERVGFSAKTTINRKDFGVNWNQALEAGGVLVGEKVEIELDIQAIKGK